MIKLSKTWMLLVASFWLAGCDSATKSGANTIFVDIEPTAYFTGRIAGDLYTIETLAGDGQDPHTFTPGPKQIKALNGSRAFIHMGMPFGQSLVSKIDGGPKIIDASEGIARITSRQKCGDHFHEGDDPHIWMSPKLAIKICDEIRDRLCLLDPENADSFRANHRLLVDELEILEKELKRSLLPCKGSKFFVFHSAFGYLARDYGLVQVAVETGGGSPGPKHIKNLIDSAKKENVRVIFVQETFPETAAKKIADKIGGAVVALDPLSYDYIANMKKIAKELESAMGGE